MLFLFKTNEDPERGWMWNIYPNKTLGGTEVEILDKNYIITPSIRKVLLDSSYNSAKSIDDMIKVVFRYIYYKKLIIIFVYKQQAVYQVPIKKIKNDFVDHVRRILNLNTKLDGRGIEKIIIPSNIIDIYTRLEFLLGLKLSGHTETLTEASNLIDQFYRMGENKTKNNIEKLFLKLILKKWNFLVKY